MCKCTQCVPAAPHRLRLRKQARYLSGTQNKDAPSCVIQPLALLQWLLSPFYLLTFYLLFKPGSRHVLLPSLSSRCISAARCLISGFHPGSFRFSPRLANTWNTKVQHVPWETDFTVFACSIGTRVWGCHLQGIWGRHHGCSDTTGAPAKGGTMSPLPLPFAPALL